MEEGNGSNDHIDQPKAYFIFHNIPHVLPGFWAIPPMDENPIEHLDSTYGHVVDVVFTSIVNFLGRLGGLYINMGSRGYLQIHSPRVFWDVDSFREMLHEVLSEHRVSQENDAIVWHRTNVQYLFDRIPKDSQVIGCLLDDQRENRKELISIHDYLEFLVHRSKNLVFVMGDFQNYKELEEHIDEYVEVSNPGTPANICVKFLCQECQERWKLI